MLICLIPKSNHPRLLSDYRSISLCNVIIKIVTKTIANRFNNVLFNIIANIKNKNKGYVGIKLDMAKGCDIKWVFCGKTLLAMKFPIKLVNTIMCCVNFVSFFVLITG